MPTKINLEGQSWYGLWKKYPILLFAIGNISEQLVTFPKPKQNVAEVISTDLGIDGDGGNENHKAADKQVLRVIWKIALPSGLVVDNEKLEQLLQCLREFCQVVVKPTTMAFRMHTSYRLNCQSGRTDTIDVKAMCA
jgi:hypothetical protein